MNFTDETLPEFGLSKNISSNVDGQELNDLTSQAYEFDSGHITWLLACTAVTWLMVSKFSSLCFHVETEN